MTIDVSESQPGSQPVETTHSPADPTASRGLSGVGRLLLGGAGLMAGVGAGVAGYAFFYEPMNIQLERISVRLPHAADRLPPRGLRILHLTDTHFMGRDRREQAKINRICRQVADLDYDILVHTGDFWHVNRGRKNVAALLDALPKPKLAAYAVLGNHDYTHYSMLEALPRMWRAFQQRERARNQGGALPRRISPAVMRRFMHFVRDTPIDGRGTGFNDAAALIDLLKQRGFQILHNQSVHLTAQAVPAAGPAAGSLDIYIAGIDDVVEGRPRIHHALDNVPADAPTILLSHNPDVIRSPRINQVDLVLAGHTHGGQIVLPFWGPAHTQVEHLERREVAGFFRRGETQIYISRGIGEGIPIRFGATPQFALITVTA